MHPPLPNATFWVQYKRITFVVNSYIDKPHPWKQVLFSTNNDLTITWDLLKIRFEFLF